MVPCYGQKNTRMTDNRATIKEDTRLSSSLQQIGEDKLYVWFILVNELRW
jgi:hypothetical protein